MNIKDDKEKINFYFDESGSITNSKKLNNKYFLIGGISTNNAKHTTRVFKKAKQKYIKHNKLDIDVKKELKGSDIDLNFKKYIFSELINKTDISFYFIVFDNHNSYFHLNLQPSIAFNYLIYLLLDKSFNNCDILNINIDNRNIAITNLNSLQDYLTVKFRVESLKVNHSVSVKYFESQNNQLIQIADIFCNFVYRILKGLEFNNNQNEAIEIFNMLKIKSIKTMDYFPQSKCSNYLFSKK